MFLLGYNRIDVKPVSAAMSEDSTFGKLKLNVHKYRVLESDEPSPGDLIIANHTSYLDLFYLRMAYAAQFTRVSAYPPHHIYASSLFECLFGQDNIISEEKLGERQGLVDVLKNAKRPTVVFPEGSRTNGRALIRFVADLSGLTPNQRVHVLSLRHENFGDRCTAPSFPVFTFKGLLKHVWAMLSQWGNSLAVKCLPPTSFYTTNFPTPADPNFRSTVEELMLDITPHVRPTSFNMVDKLAFLRAYLARK